MEFRTAPFDMLLPDPSYLTLEPEDFLDIIDEDGFIIDESEEALHLMDDEELKAIADFEEQYC
jgi:hypothetical protein